ncbi:alpha-L-fucosidase [Pedobacter sp. JY14-1]|uniref:alpha-L-fucosidase n=1 Tax=Pedobacter sp. JY14-1 TaxID=3034151 RepID=UPI0023E2DD36|nr:alpha-L-fucosidase [Pedobacter sp. JY14-1]
MNRPLWLFIYFSLFIPVLNIADARAQKKQRKFTTSYPLPRLPGKLPVDSIPMGDQSFDELKLDIPVAEGPFKPTWSSIEMNYPGEPEWLRDSKFGIWVHFGPQASGESGDWYARYLYNPRKQAYANHQKTWGHPSESGYKEVLRDWNPSKLDPKELARIYHDAGARFLLIQGVHHDNFDLWDSRYQPWNSVNIGPRRDLIGEWAKACRENNLFFGVTFHHEYTWWWWQTAFGSDHQGARKGVPYDGNLTAKDGKGKWWEGLDPRLLYGIDLREYKHVAESAETDWSPPPPGIFNRHLAYAKWYASQWALRMMDVVHKYDPDFIYTDGTVQGPFTGDGTGTGLKADAMQRVIADYYNTALKRRGKVNTFSIVKFRDKTNGTVTTEEFAIPSHIKTDQPWIAEAPVGDWFYAPGFTYDSGMMIRYVIEAIARDGNAAICISLLPDGSIDKGSKDMLREVGDWMRINGAGVYGSRAWKVPGEGELIDGKLKMLPGGKLGKYQAEFKFSAQDIRFTTGKDGALYAFVMSVPQAQEKLLVRSLPLKGESGETIVRKVSLLGHDATIKFEQNADGLYITCPGQMRFKTAVVFRIE